MPWRLPIVMTRLHSNTLTKGDLVTMTGLAKLKEAASARGKAVTASALDMAKKPLRIMNVVQHQVTLTNDNNEPVTATRTVFDVQDITGRKDTVAFTSQAAALFGAEVIEAMGPVPWDDEVWVEWSQVTTSKKRRTYQFDVIDPPDA